MYKFSKNKKCACFEHAHSNINTTPSIDSVMVVQHTFVQLITRDADYNYRNRCKQSKYNHILFDFKYVFFVSF